VTSLTQKLIFGQRCKKAVTFVNMYVQYIYLIVLYLTMYHNFAAVSVKCEIPGNVDNGKLHFT